MAKPWMLQLRGCGIQLRPFVRRACAGENFCLGKRTAGLNTGNSFPKFYIQLPNVG